MKPQVCVMCAIVWYLYNVYEKINKHEKYLITSMWRACIEFYANVEAYGDSTGSDG